MKKQLITALLLCSLSLPSLAQNVSPGRLGVQPTLDPEGVFVLDKNGTWVSIGSMTGGEFTPVAGGGGTFTWPGSAGVAAGGTSAGLGTMPFVNAYLPGLLPGFATVPTFNFGSIGPAATQATLAALLTALGSPLQANGTVNISGIGGIATQTTSAAILAALGAPLQNTGGGTPITGQTLGSGGVGIIGWLSQVYAGMTQGVFTPGGTFPGQGVITGGQDVAGLPQPVYIDPCNQKRSTVDVVTATGTATTLVAAVAGKKIYLCAGTTVIPSAALNWSMVEGTGGTCTTPIGVYLNQASAPTAATGASLVANEGLAPPGPTFAQTSLAGTTLCQVFTTTNAPTVNAHIVFVQE